MQSYLSWGQFWTEPSLITFWGEKLFCERKNTSNVHNIQSCAPIPNEFKGHHQYYCAQLVEVVAVSSPPPLTSPPKNVRCFCCVALESAKHLLSLLLSTAGRLQLEVQSRHFPAESGQKGLRVPETVQLEAGGRCVPPLDCRAGEDMNCLRCWSVVCSLVIMIFFTQISSVTWCLNFTAEIISKWASAPPHLVCRAGGDVNCLGCWSAVCSLVIMISPRFHL